MSTITPSFILGLILLVYLSTFVLFAIVRIVTGISIQRLGFSGLRRIKFRPREGLQIDIRGVGLSVHRPTLAQPTWISIRLSELNVTIDLTELGRVKAYRPPQPGGWQEWRRNRSDRDPNASSAKTWEQLSKLKEKLKAIHRQIFWLRMFDFVATNTSVEIVEIGEVTLASVTLALDTRRKKGQTVKGGAQQGSQPAEWIGTLRGLYLTLDKCEATELLDNGTINLDGSLQPSEGLAMRDASLAVKLGRVTVPIDDIKAVIDRMKAARQTLKEDYKMSETDAMSGSGAETETEAITTEPETSEEKCESGQSSPDTVYGDLGKEQDGPKRKGWPDLLQALLTSVLEVQFAITSASVSKHIRSPDVREGLVTVSVSMKELGIDLLRLDPDSPTHLTYFPRTDTSHQALIAGISVAVGIDRGTDGVEHVLSIPMMTATVRTTLPTKFVELLNSNNQKLSNVGLAGPTKTSFESVLVASLVVTSPSLDIDPRHVPILLNLMKSASGGRSRKHHSYSKSFYTRPSLNIPTPQKHHRLMSKLLPRASVRTSIHEPVIRVALPASGSNLPPGAFDLLIGTMTSIGLDFDSSYSHTKSSHYAANGVFRVSAAQLYYQTFSGEKHSMLVADSLDVKTQINASNTVAVAASATIQNCGIHLVRPEIGRGIRQILAQMSSAQNKTASLPTNESFLRKLPSWLVSVQIQCIDLSIEVAGLDPVVSSKSKGLALHVEQWNADYQNDSRTEDAPSRINRRRGSSRVIAPEDFLRLNGLVSPTSPRRTPIGIHPGSSARTDGRRLVLAIHRLGVYVITGDGDDGWDPIPLVSVPHAEVVVETKTEKDGPMCTTSCTAQAIFIQYSLFRHYAIIVALAVLKETFAQEARSKEKEGVSAGANSLGIKLGPSITNRGDPPQVVNASSPTKSFSAPATGRLHLRGDSWRGVESLAFAFVARFIQVKIDGPNGEPALIQIRDLEAESRPWGLPTVRLRQFRLCVPTPQLTTTWSRVIDIRNGHVDFGYNREVGREPQIAIDVNTDRVRVVVPDQMVVYRLVDNLVTLAKTVKELPRRVSLHGWPDETESETRPDEKVPLKGPQPAIKVPSITIQTKTLLVELDDSPFEWKLGLIYRVGLAEQAQRLARNVAFKHKAMWAGVSAGPSGTSKRSRSAQRDKTRASVDMKRSKSAARPESRGHKAENIEVPVGRFSPLYAPDKPLGLGDSSRRSNTDALTMLHIYNLRSWKTRIDRAIAEVQDNSREPDDPDPVPQYIDQTETRVLATSRRPALLSILASDLVLEIRKPSFGTEGLVDFISTIGKGMPESMEYSLLVPMGVRLTMNRLHATLRDYPLKFWDVPNGGLELRTDFVVAEEYRDHESIRWVKVNVVPPSNQDEDLDTGHDRGLTLVVPRTVAPVKSYSDISADILSAGSTKIAWANSYQPAIQDLMQVVEGFTKPPIDTSERMGFWDKIRLTFHSRMQIRLLNGGDLQLVLKGSRDPYQLLGDGAGFVFCWQDQVVGRVAYGPPEEFIVIDSGLFLLAVPDFSSIALREQAWMTSLGVPPRPDGADSPLDDIGSETLFSKTIMKLTGKVKWQAGLLFERLADDGQRTFDFAPHYSVVLKDPSHITAGHDAYAGFRSTFIHMIVSILATARTDQDDEGTDDQFVGQARVKKPAVAGYNSIHLSPQLFTHFFSWWSLFSGVMSLPIRQGNIWPGEARASKKFGRHLDTIKYSLLLEPVYLAHVYRHADVDNPSNVAYSAATGLKGRVGEFRMGMNQRREELKVNPHVQGKKRQQGTTMTIHQARVDCVATDLRAIEAKIYEPELDIPNEDEADKPSPPPIVGKVTVADKDMTWIDMDDFRELDWTAAREINLMTNVLGLMYSPRVTYSRETDRHSDGGTTVFGEEEASDPRRVQATLIGERLQEIVEQIKKADRKIGNVRLREIRMDITEKEGTLETARLTKHRGELDHKMQFLKRMRVVLLEKVGEWALATEEAKGLTRQELDLSDFSAADDDASLADFVHDFDNRFIVHNSQLKWNNSLRNIILRYSHQVSERRGLVYYSSRRAVQFLLDVVEEQRVRRVRERERHPHRKGSSNKTEMDGDGGIEQEVDEHLDGMVAAMRDFIDNGGADSIRTSVESQEGSVPNIAVDGLTPTKLTASGPHMPQQKKAPLELTALKYYHARLIAPQIQFQSEKNPTAAVLATATNMQLKVIQIMDRARVLDDVSGLIQRQYSATMDRVQIFVTDEDLWEADNDGTGRLNHQSAETNIRVGSATGDSRSETGIGRGSSSDAQSSRKKNGRKGDELNSSRMWPPWVPMEVMFEFTGDPTGFMRVIQRTNANMRYDKYNTLRVGSNGHSNGHGGSDGSNSMSGSVSHGSPTDRIWIGFPHIRATCDSAQYDAVYYIVLDLLLYVEPLEKDQKAKLDRILLSSDFSDLSDVPALVGVLQDRVRELEVIRINFLHRGRTALVTGSDADGLGPVGWRSLRQVEADLVQVREELFFTIKAVAASQRRRDKDRAGDVPRAGIPAPSTPTDLADEQLDDTSGIQHWTIQAAEIEWALIRGRAGQEREPLVRMRLKDARYDRVDQADGSNRNVIAVGVIDGVNLLPGAVYRQMISAYGRPPAYPPSYGLSTPARLESGDSPSSRASGFLSSAPNSGGINPALLSAATAAAAAAAAALPGAGTAASVLGGKMVRVEWYVLEAIGGISIIYQFEAQIVPLRVQLERDVGVKLLEYIFPTVADPEGSLNDDEDGTNEDGDGNDGGLMGEVGGEGDLGVAADSDGTSDWSDSGDEGGGGGSGGQGSKSSPTARMIPTLGAGRLARLGNKAVDRALALIASAGVPPGSTNTAVTDASSSMHSSISTNLPIVHTSNLKKPTKAASIRSVSPPRRKLEVRSFTFGGLMSRSTAGAGAGAGAVSGATGDGPSTGIEDSRSIRSRTSGRSKMKGSLFSDGGDGLLARPATTKSSDGRSRLRPRKGKSGALSGTLLPDRTHSKVVADDELTLMLHRASQYRILASVRIPAITMCVSYKGKGQRNLEDVRDLVVRMPMLEYKNKIWSNRDLVMQLRREFRNALISHAGAIIGNKFRRHDDSMSTISKLVAPGPTPYFIGEVTGASDSSRSSGLMRIDGDNPDGGAPDSTLLASSSSFRTGVANMFHRKRPGSSHTPQGDRASSSGGLLSQGTPSSSSSLYAIQRPRSSRSLTGLGTGSGSDTFLSHLQRQRNPHTPQSTTVIAATSATSATAIPIYSNRRTSAVPMPIPTPSGFTPVSATPSKQPMGYFDATDVSVREDINEQPPMLRVDDTLGDGDGDDYDNDDDNDDLERYITCLPVPRRSTEYKDIGETTTPPTSHEQSAKSSRWARIGHGLGGIGKGVHRRHQSNETISGGGSSSIRSGIVGAFGLGRSKATTATGTIRPSSSVGPSPPQFPPRGGSVGDGGRGLMESSILPDLPTTPTPSGPAPGMEKRRLGVGRTDEVGRGMDDLQPRGV